MKWNNLKDMRCPKCSAMLYKSNGGYACSGSKCEFFIREERFDTVIQSIYKPKERSTENMTGEERLSELNNYGREPRPEYGE